MSRSKWKGSFINISLHKSFLNNKYKIWSRKSTIPFELIKKAVYIHNGKIFKKIYINRNRVGYKFGEFAFTRIKFFDKRKKNKNLLNKKDKKIISKK